MGSERYGALLEALEALLETHAFQLERSAEGAALVEGEGVYVVLPLAEMADAHKESGVDVVSWASSFVEGVAAVLDASPADEELTFAEAAAVLVPRLEGAGFSAGVRAAGGERVYMRPWADSLRITYWLTLDLGPRLVTASEVERWGVSDDRMSSAARSLLYHRTEEAAATVKDEVSCYAIGDGYDTGRVMVLEDLQWGRFDGALLLGVPSTGRLVFRAATDRAEDVAAFRAMVEADYDAATRPLALGVFRLERGRVMALG